MSWGQQWAPYVSVTQKLNKAVRHAARIAKQQKREPQPVNLQSRQIAQTFWGKAWCDNLAAYQDFSNRLPRGATYVRNGSVVDLVINPKKIEAIVAGSEPYTIRIEIRELEKKRWKAIRSDCSESIDSLLDLLSGKLSDGVMRRLTEQKSGLFPSPAEIKMTCSCPDYSSCCKHLAAVMYGVGARLDTRPELLFLLRGVDHQDLVSQAIASGNLDRELAGTGSSLDSQDLGAIFGIELDSTSGNLSLPAGIRKPTRGRKPAPKKSVSASVSEAVKAVAAKKSTGIAKVSARAKKTKTGSAKATKRESTAAQSLAVATAFLTKPGTARTEQSVKDSKPTGKPRAAVKGKRTSR